MWGWSTAYSLSILGVNTVVFDTQDTLLQGLSDLEIAVIGGQAVLYAASEANNAITSFWLSASGVPTRVTDVAYSSSSGTYAVSDLTAYQAGGQSYLVSLGRYDDGFGLYGIGAGGGLNPQGELSDSGDTFERGLASETFTLDGTDYLISSAFGKGGFQLFEIGTGGGLTNILDIADSGARRLGDVVDFEIATLHDKSFLFTVSSLEAGLHSWAIGTGGTLEERDSALPGDASGFAASTVVEAVDMGLRSFVIMGSAGTDSLTVYRVSKGGDLKEVDHLIDSYQTRFADITALKILQGGDRTLVVAGGSDAGITVFELTWQGKLNLVEVLVDDFDTALATISDIEAIIDGDTAHLYVSSGTDHGITVLTVDLSRSGAVIEGGAVEDTLTGTAGDDVLWGYGRADALFGADGADRLIDGLGRDEMTGGAGADIFEFIPDNATDRVLDFEIGIDRLDLTNYDNLHHISSLTIEQRVDGIVICVQEDIIRLIHPAGDILDPHALTQDDFIFG